MDRKVRALPSPGRGRACPGAKMNPTGQHHVLGMILMATAVTLNATKDGLAKIMAGAFSPLLILWAQFAVTLIVLLPLIVPRHGWRALLPRPLGSQILRGLFLTCGVGLFYWSVRFVSLAEATAMVLVGPLVVTALSPFILGERVGVRRWTAVVIGLIGVLVILRPDFTGDRYGHFMALGAGTSLGLYYIYNRLLAHASSPLVTVANAVIVGTVVLAPMVPLVWTSPAAEDAMIIVAFLCISTLGHFFMVSSFRFAPASIVAPVVYFQIVGATAFDLIVFGAFPDTTTLIGIAIIVGAGIYIGVREAR